MMRVIMALFWGLVIFWLLTTDADAQTAPSPVAWPQRVEGNSPESKDKARFIALQNARQAVLEYLRAQRPPLKSWEPALSEIDELIEKEEVLPRQNEGGYVFERVALTLRPLKPADLESFRRRDRHAYLKLEEQQREVRRIARTILAAKVVVGLMIVLAVALLYVRIDDATHRAYTRWLQAAAAVLVAGTSVGLWMLP